MAIIIVIAKKNKKNKFFKITIKKNKYILQYN